MNACEDERTCICLEAKTKKRWRAPEIVPTAAVSQHLTGAGVHSPTHSALNSRSSRYGSGGLGIEALSHDYRCCAPTALGPKPHCLHIALSTTHVLRFARRSCLSSRSKQRTGRSSTHRRAPPPKTKTGHGQPLSRCTKAFPSWSLFSFCLSISSVTCFTAHAALRDADVRNFAHGETQPWQEAVGGAARLP